MIMDIIVHRNNCHPQSFLGHHSENHCLQSFMDPIFLFPNSSSGSQKKERGQMNFQDLEQSSTIISREDIIVLH